jgi:hypothetical protein
VTELALLSIIPKRTLVGVSCCVVLAAHAAEPYSIYENRRFDFSIDVPVILEPEGESDNGDGQRFSSRSGHATALVYGSHGGPCTARGMIADLQGSTITYSFARGGASVVSGYRRGNIFYKKAIQKNDRCLMLDIEYDARLRQVYDAVVTRMEKSFGE